MNPLDIHLKFPNESVATALIVESGVWLKSIDEQGNVHYYDAPNYLTDVIGLIFRPVDAAVDVGGWHINMRGVLPEELKQYKVIVTGIPHRIWD